MMKQRPETGKTNRLQIPRPAPDRQPPLLDNHLQQDERHLGAHEMASKQDVHVAKAEVVPTSSLTLIE
jgi:hypothetical protein